MSDSDSERIPFTTELALKVGFRAGYRPWETMSLTLSELELLAKVHAEQEENQNATEIFYRHLQGQLFHWDPRKYPKYEALLPKKRKIKKRDTEEMKQQFSAIGCRMP